VGAIIKTEWLLSKPISTAPISTAGQKFNAT